MKGPKLLYLLFAAAAVALIAWLMHRAERGSWQEQAIAAGAKILGEFPVNEVTTVALEGPDGRVTLQRSESGWGVVERAGYPADFEKVSGLVLDLSGLEAVQSVPVAESDYGALALRTGGGDIPREEAGLKVDLQGAGGKALASVILGKTHMTAPSGIRPEIGGTASGRYVLPGGSRDNAYLVSETFADLQTSPAQWIDKTFVRPGMPKEFAVKSSEGEWTLTREVSGAPWTMPGLRKNQTLDMARVAGIDAMLTSMTVADVPDGPDDTRVKPLEENPVTVTVETFDGIRYVLIIGRGDGDNLPVKVSAEPAAGSGELAEEAEKARDEKLAAVEKFKDRVVFIPRNFVAPFLQERAELLGEVKK